MSETQGSWCLVEIPGKPPRAAILPPLQRGRLARIAGSVITPLDDDPLIIPGDTSLIAYPLSVLGFNVLSTDFFVAAVRELTPDESAAGEAVPGDVLPFGSDYRALRHIFYIRRARGGALKFELIKSGHAEIVYTEDRFSIDNERTLKRAQSGLGYLARNYRANGKIVDCVIGVQDGFKTHGQSTWHEDGRYALDVQKKHLAVMGDYLRILAGQCVNELMRIDGLGPVRISAEQNPRTDSDYSVIFVGTSGSFETATGKPRSDIYSDVRGKPGLAIFGLSDAPAGLSMKSAYSEFLRLLDCCPDNPGVCAAPVGVLVLTAISTVDKTYRVIPYTHGKSDSGKTSFAKLLLATQSPSARGYNLVPVTVSARPARKGGSTANGNLMHLQYAGGFFALVDDYTTEKMGAQSLIERGEGLSILVGSLEGQPPAKQTWTKSGPDFAQTFSPQCSFMISGEITCSDEESVINRLIELHAPADHFNAPEGYAKDLMLDLDKAESGDLRHAAFCDLMRWTLANPQTVSRAYDEACELTDSWEDIGSARMRARYAIPLAGLMLAIERAAEHGLDESNRLPGIVATLHETARAQYARITVAADPLGALQRAICEALADEEISFPGWPMYSEDGDARSEFTDPFYEESENPEEQTGILPPDFIQDRAELGMHPSTTGWTPGKCIAGYFVRPRKYGNSAFPYRVQIPTKTYLGRLARVLDKRDGRNGFYTETTVRAILLASEHAKPGKGGGIKSDKCRTIDINAQWLFASEESEED